jgi:lactate 2-monooxygenase
VSSAREQKPTTDETTVTGRNRSSEKMADEEDPNSRPPYHTFQSEIYQKGVLAGEKPLVTTNPNQLEHDARKAMKPEAFNYVFGGAGEHATMEANRLAFRQWKIIPRFLRPTLPRDLTVTLFGKTYGEAEAKTFTKKMHMPCPAPDGFF